MPLTEEDVKMLVDRLGDKMELFMAKVMKEHMDTVHEKLYDRVGKLERAVTFWRGASAVGGLIFSIILALLARH